MSTSSDLLWFLQEQRHVFVICPCCDEVIRLADARISYRRRYSDDWLDTIERAEEAVERRVEKFEEQEAEIRRQSIERARKKVLPQLLRRVTPALSRLKISPMDVKTLLDPVGYIAFDGLNSTRGTRRVVLLDLPARDPARETLHATLRETLSAGNIQWTTIRIDREGQVLPEVEAR